MSPVDPTSVRPADRFTPVTPGTRCPRCDYLLDGLFRGGKCPECGTPIRSRTKAGLQARDNLTDAPEEYLRRLRVVIVTLAMLGVANGLLQAYAHVASPSILPWLMAFAGAAWAVVVFPATAPRPYSESAHKRPTEELRWARWGARITQCVWPLQGILYIALLRAEAVTSPLADNYRAGARLAQLVGMLGFLPLCAWLAHLADWAQHSALAGRLRAAGVLVGIGGVVFLITLTATMALAGSAAGAIVGMLALLALFAYEIGVVIFVASLLQLAHMALWAVINAKATIERDRRVMERKARRMFAGQAAEGTPLAEMTAQRGEGVLDPCAHCGYDLTGLPPGAKCPECGAELEHRDVTMLVGRPAVAPKDLEDIPLVGDEHEADPPGGDPTSEGR